MTFKEKLESQEAEEGTNLTLRCEISKPGVQVEWKKGTQVLKSGEKYQMKQKDTVNELLINKVVPDDSGDYSCVCGDQRTTASLNVKGRKRISQDVVYGALLNMFFFRVCMSLWIANGLSLSFFVLCTLL